jgi:hypothetical protein
MLNINDKVKILDLLKGGMSVTEFGWCYEKNSRIYRTVLNSMHPEHLWVFLNSSLLATIYLWIPRVYCMQHILGELLLQST